MREICMSGATREGLGRKPDPSTLPSLRLSIIRTGSDVRFGCGSEFMPRWNHFLPKGNVGDAGSGRSEGVRLPPLLCVVTANPASRRFSWWHSGA